MCSHIYVYVWMAGRMDAQKTVQAQTNQFYLLFF